MPDEAMPGRGVEKSVYLVGGLGLGLLGIQDLAATAVSVYGGTYNPNGRALDIASPTWAGWAAGVVVGVLFLLGSAYLLLRARRLSPTQPANAPRPVSAAQ